MAIVAVTRVTPANSEAAALYRARVEGDCIRLELLERVHIEVNHVACRIVAELDVAAQLRLKLNVSQIVLRDEKRRCQIEQAIGGENLEPGVLAHSVGKVARNVGVAHRLPLPSASRGSGRSQAVRVIPSLINSGSGWEINLVRRVLQFAIQIIVQGRYEGTLDAGVGRVVSRSLAGGVDIGPFETRVVAA